jgi:hypothetical protein
MRRTRWNVSSTKWWILRGRTYVFQAAHALQTLLYVLEFVPVGLCVCVSRCLPVGGESGGYSEEEKKNIQRHPERPSKLQDTQKKQEQVRDKGNLRQHNGGNQSPHSDHYTYHSAPHTSETQHTSTESHCQDDTSPVRSTAQS